jgi:hypothetical protein
MLKVRPLHKRGLQYSSELLKTLQVLTINTTGGARTHVSIRTFRTFRLLFMFALWPKLSLVS